MPSLRQQIIEESARAFAAYDSGNKYVASGRQAAADKAVEGVVGFNHIGVAWTTVGRSAIDWSGQHRTHQEWRAQLNRFFFLTPLSGAYKETGDAKYAEAARDFIADWLRANPTVADWKMQPYDDTLNLAIRVQQWLGSLSQFLAGEIFDDALVEQMIESVNAQLAYLMENLKPEGNWRIGQADSLMTAGLILAFDPRSARWIEAGVRILNEAVMRQVLSDGVHIERNPDYHTWMTVIFEKYWSLGKNRPELGLAVTTDVVARMHDYFLACRKPNGQLNGLHDSNGRAVAKRAENWSQTRANFRMRAGLSDELPPTSQFFPQAGQACLRDGWGEDATYLAFDASTWGGTHCHLSRNAVQLHAHGRSVLIDPGTLTYETSDPMMAYGKSTRAHNTVTLNGWNQATTNPQRTRHLALPGYDLVESQYVGGYWPMTYHWWIVDGYGKGMFGEHHRSMLWIHGRAVVVLDHVTHTATAGNKPSIESTWQFSAGKVRLLDDNAGAVSEFPDGNAMLLFPLQAPGSNVRIYEGAREPLRGWLQGESGFVPAPQVCVAAPEVDAWATHLATVIVPFAGPVAPQVSARFVANTTRPAGDPPGFLELMWADGSTDRVYWTRRLELSMGVRPDRSGTNLRTDAALLHLRHDCNQRLLGGLVVDGSYVEPYSPKARNSLQSFTLDAQ